MTEDIQPEVLKRTQDVLGKYIKKPPLTEKLLKKPPFRFLHDIVTSAMKETGVFEGLLNTTEMKAENIKDKEGKIAFLQKIISAVEAANGVKLSVRPNKIVAGHEPTKTNEFLQALGNVITLKLENGVNPEESLTKAKPKNPPKKPKEETQVKKRTPNKETKKTKTEKNKPVENGTGDEIRKKTSKRVSRDGERSKQVGEEAEVGQERQRKDEEEKVVNGDDVGRKGEGDGHELVEREVNNRPQSAKPGHRKPSARHPLDKNVTSASRSNQVVDNTDESLVGAGTTVERSESVLGEKVKFRSDSVVSNNNLVNNITDNSYQHDDMLGDRVTATPSPPVHDVSVNKEETNVAANRPASVRPKTSVRPASARPAAPRIRDRGEVVLQEELIRPVTGKVNVIIENDSVVNNQDDDDNIVSLETTNDVNVEEDEPLLLMTRKSSSGEHGHLVEQILETQKELEDTSRLPKSKLTGGQVEIEWESGRNRESTTREVEKLRNCIQTLTRSANPLGKLLDFVQEDVDTMETELEKWKEMNTSLGMQLAQEQSLTEQSIEPLKMHLNEIQRNIEHERQVISFLKSNIIRNDEKIKQLLMGK